MQVFTPFQVADKAGNKYLGVLVAAKFARYVNEFFPREGTSFEEDRKSVV